MLVKTTNPVIVADVGIIPLSGGRSAIVDIEDFHRLKRYKWHYHRFGNTYYAARVVYSKNKSFHVYMHRQVTHCPKAKTVHHLNGNGLDNRRSNLLVCTKQEHNFFH